MNENNQNNDKTQTISPSRLTLKTPIDSAQIKQNLSSKSNIVTVVKKKRVFSQDENEEANQSRVQSDKNLLQNNNLKNLAENKFDQRLSVLKKAADNYKIFESRDLSKPVKEEPVIEQEILLKDEKLEEIENVILPNVEHVEHHISSKEKFKSADSNEEDDDEQEKSKGKAKVDTKFVKFKLDNSRRKSGKINVNALSDQDEEGGKKRSLSSIRRAREKARRAESLQRSDNEKIVREITVSEFIAVSELANRMSVRAADVIRELMKLGMIVSANSEIDSDTSEIIIDTFGHKIKRVFESDIENIFLAEEDISENLIKRAPVVTIMGHVDHGKTSLLDALRETDVVSGEAGGITQHIGAYSIKLENGETITFIDTPGHEAFTAMRARGAKATDIVVLVVAADDGVMEQTREAISHAKAAEVPIIVAINKIDKPDSNPERVRSELLTHDLVLEEFGGDVMAVNVSAKSKLNLDKLEEAILLQAEMLNLKANPNTDSSGIVIESKIDKNKGVVTTLLVQRGTLRVGDIVVAGSGFGKVKTLLDDKAFNIEEAMPSMPVEVLGFSSAPEAGEKFAVTKTEKQAREIAEYRERKAKFYKNSSVQKGTLADLFAKAKGKDKTLSIILKGDVQGSVEAIIGSLAKIQSDEVKLKILHSGVGGITQSDIVLANASNGIVIGFNVRADSVAKSAAEASGVDYRYYSIIYNLVDDIKAVLSGMLSPIRREIYTGAVKILQVFNITKAGKIAGSLVTDGIIRLGSNVRLIRDNIVIYEGKIKTLKRYKEDAKEVRESQECGIQMENYEDLKVNDLVEVFEVTEEKKILQ